MLKRYDDKGTMGCLKSLAILAAILAATTTVVGELIHIPWHIFHTLFPENVPNSRVPSYIMGWAVTYVVARDICKLISRLNKLNQKLLDESKQR